MCAVRRKHQALAAASGAGGGPSKVVEVVEGYECARERDGLRGAVGSHELEAQLNKCEVVPPELSTPHRPWREQVDHSKVAMVRRAHLATLPLDAIEIRVPCAILGLVRDAPRDAVAIVGARDVRD